MLNGCGFATAFSRPTGMRRIGHLTGTPNNHNIDVFRRELRGRGWLEGETLSIEFRFTQGRLDQVADLVDELGQVPVELIVAVSPSLVVAAAQRAGSIAIVGVALGDPLQMGLAASLARPGGSATGTSNLSPATSSKRLELLRELLPSVSRVAVFARPEVESTALGWEETRAAADTFGLQLLRVDVHSVSDLPMAFAAAVNWRSDAIGFLPIALDHLMLEAGVLDMAAQTGLPVFYSNRAFVEDGGLMAYAARLDEQYCRAAAQVDKILRGAKPADLPMERTTSFEFFVNPKAAQALGLSFPPEVAAQVTEWVE